MRCETVRKKLDRLSQQELTSRMREAVETHLSACEDCRRHFARQKRLAAILTSVPEPPAMPQGFGDRVLEMARQRQAAQRPVPGSIWRIGWLRSSGSAGKIAAQTAVLAGGVLLGVFMGHQTWQSAYPTNQRQATQSDPVAVYELDYLTDAPGDSLAGSYLTLMATPKHNGT
jgi:anti-sigma factor RsiW